jgi:hypothetical protein
VGEAEVLGPMPGVSPSELDAIYGYATHDLTPPGQILVITIGYESADPREQQ